MAVLQDDKIDPRVPGRRCGTCTLCCKILRIEELKKPQGKWCDHCEIGVGCRIYDRRSKECASFFCGYLTRSDLSEAWRPTTSKIVLVAELGGNRIAAHVDPGRPSAWRSEPYYSQLKQWAFEAVPYRGQVVAYIGKRAIVILPDEDVDLGIIGDDELIVTAERKGPAGPIMLDAMKLKRDDPRAAHLKDK